MATNKPILVTGIHKSGKSFVSNGLKTTKKVNVIYEPLNLNTRIGLNGIRPKYWYQFLDDNDQDFEDAIKGILDYKYWFGKEVLAIREPKDIYKIIRDYQRIVQSRKLQNTTRPLIDDPFAVLSADWFYYTFNMDVIILVRHPASFISSLIIKNRQHPFGHFLAQKELMETKLKPFEKEIREFAQTQQSVIDQGILLWRIIYSVVHGFKTEFKEKWMFIKLEDMAVNPTERFYDVFNFLKINRNTEVEKGLLKYLQAGIGEDSQNQAHEKVALTHPFQIGEQVAYYLNYLSNDEISYIKEQTLDVWPLFYEEKDWLLK